MLEAKAQYIELSFKVSKSLPVIVLRVRSDPARIPFRVLTGPSTYNLGGAAVITHY